MANPTIDILSARSLTNAMTQMITPEPFVLDKIFKTREFHATDTIDAEMSTYGANLAKFRSDNDEAVAINKNTREIQTFKVPMTFEKKIFTAKELADYNTIGNIYGENSDARTRARNDWVLNNLNDLRNRVIRRREKMAIDAITTGSIAVLADDTTFTMNYGFVAGQQTETLSATTKWNATTGKPQNDIRRFKKLISQRTGVNMDMLLLGSNAADDFISSDVIKKELDTNNNKVGTLVLTNAPTIGATYIGNVFGVDVWEINQQYNLSGTATDMFGTNVALAVASGADFKLHSAPAFRIAPNGGLDVINAEFYVYPEISDDRKKLSWYCEQKSLPVVHNKGAVIASTVHVA